MPDIFISYAHEDAERIQRLARTLEAEGWSVFWDRHIPAGQTWRSHIGVALQDSKCLIVAWSKHSIDSSWVCEEAEDGRQRGLLVPILLDSIKPPIGFRSIQAADLSDWQPSSSSPRFEQLLNELRAVLRATSSQPHIERVSRPEVDAVKSVQDATHWRKIPLRYVVYALAGVILTVVAGTSYWEYQRRSSPEGILSGEGRTLKDSSHELDKILDGLRGAAGPADRLRGAGAPASSAAKTAIPSTREQSASLRLTPIFGITPGVTTRRDVEELIKQNELRPFGALQKRGGDRIEFTLGVLSFQEKESDYTRNPFDTVISMEYWGDEPLPLGFRTRLGLEQAKHIAEAHFVWLGTQSFRGLVFSNKTDGPILLEISWRSGRKNPLTYKIFGPL